MQVKIGYSDYNKQVENAVIELAPEQTVQIGYVEEVIVSEDEVPAETIINKLEIKYVDETTMLEISHKMASEDVVKYISLLQRFAKQL